MRSYLYLIIDISCILIPFLASFYSPRAFYKEWKSFFLANFIVGLPFLIWDAIFTDLGVWGFNPDYLTGWNIGNLPVEEVLFFLCIPYACTFTYFALKYLLQKFQFNRSHTLTLTLLWLSALTFLILGYDQSYTFYTGLFGFLLALYFSIKKVSLGLIGITYAVIFPFFLISNGLLTGSFLANPIVWYNDIENFGLRIFTIPIEDSLYGFILIALNIHIWEVVRKVSDQATTYKFYNEDSPGKSS
ncbi:lycopene cyclase domain-containing protein [Membranihabitans marinus]|uniref:lycopene cyclase domain-containing protein n=1 Tax=Membranihabitans marinus TaxID=1227546 RepID=UPI001F01EF87|nr:lycopene cyclase domain-containing protein [Membranihabitans marinus]